MAVTVTFSPPIRTHRGDAADDTIRALFGPPDTLSNVVFGAGGDDTIFGNFTDDRLFGGAGNDLLTDTAGTDLLAGNGGRDLLQASGSGDADILLGGGGADVLTYALINLPQTPGNLTELTGGGGADTLRFNVGVALDTTTIYFDHNDGTWGYVDPNLSEIRMGTVASIETFEFQGKMQTIWEGSSASETVQAFGGSDSLYGGAGHDRLSGGDGADRIFGGNGDDLLFGGAPDSFSNGNSSLFDVLNGGRGQDVLVGTSGPARLNGGSGDDVLIGLGAGGKMVGGSGDDAFLFHAPSEATPFPDRVLSDEAEAYFAETIGGGRLPRDFAGLVINGGKGVDTIHFGGLERVNAGSADPGVTIDLSAKEAVLDPRGGGAIFKVIKVEGIVGTDHTDTIIGRAGVQTIEGGAGDDTLSGKGGDDLFIFGADSGDDVITDFDADGDQGDILDFADAGLKFRDLTITTEERNGTSGTLVETSGNDSVFLVNVARSEVTSDMFDF